MTIKTFGILAAAAVILAVLAIVAQNRPGSETIAGAAAGSVLLPDLEAEAEAVEQIAIDGAGRERLVTLERVDGTWTVAEQDGYPADLAKIRELVVALAEAAVVEEKTASPDFHARLGVEDLDQADAAGLGVTLATGAGRDFAVVLGDAYGTDQRYARRADDDQSYLIDFDPDIARAPSDWVVTEIVAVASDRVQRVEIEHRDGERLVIRKEAPEDMNFAVDDVPEGRELQYAGVANVTGNAIRDLNLEAVSRASESQEAPVAAVEFWTFDGLVVSARAFVDEAGEDADPWLEFSAREEPEQALAFAAEESADDADPAEAAATEAAATEAADPAEVADAADEGEQPAGSAVAAEAEAINARVSGWRYRVPSYQYEQMTRRIEDLLAELDQGDD